MQVLNFYKSKRNFLLVASKILQLRLASRAQNTLMEYRVPLDQEKTQRIIRPINHMLTVGHQHQQFLCYSLVKTNKADNKSFKIFQLP